MIRDSRSLPIVSMDYWSDFAKELVKLATLRPDGNILDVGTGSGACLEAVAKYMGKNCNLLGIDKNGAKISQAKERFKKIGINNAKFQIMDATNLKFEDNSFNNILSGFIGFSSDFDFKRDRFINENAKMKEIFRVLKPGGEAAFSTWMYQQDIEIARELLQKYLIDKDMKKPDEIENLSISYSKETKEGFKIIMEDAGFTNIKIYSKDFQILYKSFDEWWEVMEYAAWIMRYTLNQNENKLKDLKKYVSIQGIESFKQKNGYGFQKSVIFAFGSK